MSKNISFKSVLEIQLRVCIEGNFQQVMMVQQSPIYVFALTRDRDQNACD